MKEKGKVHKISVHKISGLFTWRLGGESCNYGNIRTHYVLTLVVTQAFTTASRASLAGGGSV
jgi:hypothetical protein